MGAPQRGRSSTHRRYGQQSANNGHDLRPKERFITAALDKGRIVLSCRIHASTIRILKKPADAFPTAPAPTEASPPLVGGALTRSAVEIGEQRCAGRGVRL